MKSILFDGDTFERNGRTFRFRAKYDQDIGPPWKEHDGHGVVSKHRHHSFGIGTKPPKRPGERILYWERGTYRTYDVQATMEIAKRDGWGLGDEDKAKLAEKLGREPTKGEIVAEAVEQDFRYLQGWCTDEWCWIGIIVEEVNSGEERSLWGIESDAYDYHREVANELADEINHHLDDIAAEEIEELAHRSGADGVAHHAHT